MTWLLHAWRRSTASCQRLCAIKFSSQQSIFEPVTSGTPLGQDEWCFKVSNV